MPGGPVGSGPPQPKTPRSPPSRYLSPAACPAHHILQVAMPGTVFKPPRHRRAGADAASNQRGKTAMVIQQRPDRTPPGRDRIAVQLGRPTPQYVGWAPSRMTRIPTLLGDVVRDGAQGKTRRRHRTAKPLIEMRSSPPAKNHGRRSPSSERDRTSPAHSTFTIPAGVSPGLSPMS